MVVTHLIKGRDDIVRAAKLKTSKEILEPAVQHLYPLELTCSQLSSTLNPAAPEFNVRPKKDTATAAAARIQELSEQSELWTLTLVRKGTLTLGYRFIRFFIFFWELCPVQELSYMSLPGMYMGEGVGDWGTHHAIVQSNLSINYRNM